MGSLYRRGNIFWMKYYVNGRAVRESTGKEKEKEAEQVLKVREGRAAAGLPALPRADKIRYDEAAADLRRHYETTGSRNMVEAEKHLNHLDAFFRGQRLVGIGGSEATTYVAQRQAKGVANGTINRELAVLTKMLRLAYENRKLLRMPVIRKLKEAAPRQGFFEREHFLAVRRPPRGSSSRGHDRLHVRLANTERSAHPRAPAARPQGGHPSAGSRHHEER